MVRHWKAMRTGERTYVQFGGTCLCRRNRREQSQRRYSEHVRERAWTLCTMKKREWDRKRQKVACFTRYVNERSGRMSSWDGQIWRPGIMVQMRHTNASMGIRLLCTGETDGKVERKADLG